MKIGKTKAGLFRPEQHSYNDTTGSYFIGSDATLETFWLPEDHELEDDILSCRICKDFGVPFGTEVDVKMKGRNLEKLRRHELA